MGYFLDRKIDIVRLVCILQFGQRIDQASGTDGHNVKTLDGSAALHMA